jgi:hypothetical protein
LMMPGSPSLFKNGRKDSVVGALPANPSVVMM